MLMDAAERFSINLRESYMLGDRWRDIEAGQNAGCKTILIEYGYEEKTPLTPPDFKAGSLYETLDWILQE